MPITQPSTVDGINELQYRHQPPATDVASESCHPFALHLAMDAESFSTL